MAQASILTRGHGPIASAIIFDLALQGGHGGDGAVHHAVYAGARIAACYGQVCTLGITQRLKNIPLRVLMR